MGVCLFSVCDDPSAFTVIWVKTFHFSCVFVFCYTKFRLKVPLIDNPNTQTQKKYKEKRQMKRGQTLTRWPLVKKKEKVIERVLLVFVYVPSIILCSSPIFTQNFGEIHLQIFASSRYCLSPWTASWPLAWPVGIWTSFCEFRYLLIFTRAIRWPTHIIHRDCWQDSLFFGTSLSPIFSLSFSLLFSVLDIVPVLLPF